MQSNMNTSWVSNSFFRTASFSFWIASTKATYINMINYVITYDEFYYQTSLWCDLRSELFKIEKLYNQMTHMCTFFVINWAFEVYQVINYYCILQYRWDKTIICSLTNSELFKINAMGRSLPFWMSCFMAFSMFPCLKSCDTYDPAKSWIIQDWLFILRHFLHLILHNITTVDACCRFLQWKPVNCLFDISVPEVPLVIAWTFFIGYRKPLRF